MPESAPTDSTPAMPDPAVASMAAAPAAAPPHALSDCAGVCLPEPAGTTADLARALDLWRRRERLLVRLRAAATAAPRLAAFLTAVERALAELPPAHFVGTCALPHMYLVTGAKEPDLTDMIGAVRLLVGHPDRALECVVPAEAFARGGLYLPHLHAVLDGRGGPVAVRGDATSVRFVWTDGEAVTVPRAGLPDDTVVPGRLRVLARECDLALLGELDEFAAVPETLRANPPADRHTLALGVELLADTWPAALTACRRIYSAAIFLRHTPEGVYSHTDNDRLPIFCASMRDPIQVAEALVHEGAHARLAPFFAVDPLLDDDGAAIHPSPWRTDPRPLSGLLNGVHAFVNICRFFRLLADRRPDLAAKVEPVLERQRGHTRGAWAYLSERARPTALGARFLADLGRAVDAL